MKNKNLIVKCLYVAAALLAFVFSLVLYINSFYYEDYGAGSFEISFNKDYLVTTFATLIILAATVISLVNYLKNRQNGALYDASYGVVTILLSFYSLGVFLKALTKGASKGKDLGPIYAENQIYFYFGLVTLVLLVAFAFQMVIKYKKNK